MGKTLINAENLTVKYKDSSEGIFDLNFEIREGEFVLLAGDSGSGKSTLLKCINGLIPQLFDAVMEGGLYLNGESIPKKPISELNKQVGSVFQNPRSQFFTTNSTSELVFAMENYAYTKDEMRDRLNELVEEFRLDKLLDRNILSLSSGERQKLALACSKSLNPRIMLFDEPSANLDYGNTMLLARMLKELKAKGHTIIIADHRFHYLKGMVDKVLLFDKGRMKTFESEEDFKASDYDTRSFELFEIADETPSHNPDDEINIRIEDLSYGTLLKDINLEVYGSEILILVGINGAGKTTLAKLLIRSLKASKGKIMCSALPLYIMQDADFQLFGSSVYNELKIAPHEVGDDRIEAALTEMGLQAYKNSHPFELSGGQKQRLQIAISMVSESKIFIFDEPTSGLDVNSMKRIAGEIEKLKKRGTVIIISHDYEFIRKVGGRVVYLKDGGINRDFILKDNLEQLETIFREMEEVTK